VNAKSLLLCAAALSSVAAPAHAQSYFFRPKAQVIVPAAPKDLTPATIAFTSKGGQTPGAEVLSEIRQLRDHDGVAVSVSGSNSSYRICADATCSTAPQWSTSAGQAERDQWVQLRQVAPAAGTKQVLTLSAGTLTATWEVESANGAFSFANMGINNAALRTALAGALGSDANWIQCTEVGTGGTESCAGASRTLVVFTASEYGQEFGLTVEGDLISSSSCWTARKGFYFTTVFQAAGRLLDSSGQATSAGQIQTCGSVQALALYSIKTDSPAGYTANAVNGIGGIAGWNTGYTLNGAPTTGGTAKSTVKWFKRR
jgi:hypothetical protein